MPVTEPTVIDLRQYTLRHIGPKAVVFPDTPGQSFTILNRTDMVARPIPTTNIPNSVDFASGSWNGRINDAGDGKIVFPNKEASDGTPWRYRFDPTNKLQWLEIYVDEYLDSVLCITKVIPDRNQVEIDGYDGFQMCKTAYVRDWTVVQAPRDVIERGTQLWVPAVVDGFTQQAPFYDAAVAATPGLQYWWKLNETTGTAAADSAGANTGTYHGDYTLNSEDPAGNFDNMCGFKSTSYVSTATLVAAPTKFTLECVTYGPTQGCLMSLGTIATGVGGNDYVALNIDNAGLVRFITYNGSYSQIVTPSALPGGVVTVVATFDGTTGAVYFDGVLQVSGAMLAPNTSGYWRLGNCCCTTLPNTPSSLFLNAGGVTIIGAGQFAVYNVALSPATIYQHWLGRGINPQWIAANGPMSIGTGGLVIAAPSTQLTSQVIAVPSTAVWSVSMTFLAPGWQSAAAIAANCYVRLVISENSVIGGGGAQYDVGVQQLAAGNQGQFGSGGAPSAYNTALLPPGISYALVMESDGEWVWAYINGQKIGCVRRTATPVTSFQVEVTASLWTAGTVTLDTFLASTLQPFLQCGTDKGDYALPGAATTYPPGGLHARYYNDLDIQSDANRLLKILSPPRSQAYAGSGGPGEYVNQQDAQVNNQQNPVNPGAPQNWSCKWFGAVYMKLTGGSYTFKVAQPGASASTAVRLWVGKTKWGDQIIDAWTWTATANVTTFTITAASLSGTLPYGGGAIARDGWYPIKLEYAVDGVVSAGDTAPVLYFTPPATYTDPGGTVLTGGASVVIPATSLSPLGMIDNRYQGTSHFDLIQKTAAAVGYQFAVEPQSLESGLFPGVLAPRVREGHDSDVILEPDDAQRREGMINYSSSVDGTDQASSVQGNGAGFQNGSTGQLQANVYDPFTLQNALFDMQAWSDNADASYSSLLQSLLSSQLANRLTPWEIVSGDPVARMRQAYTWPLPGALSQMRWRPGDGVLIRAADINVYDVTPRQLLLVTRQILPNGVASTQVGFAARPKSSVYANRLVTASALRPQRNYQKQLVTLSGSYTNGTIAAGSGSLYSPSAGWPPYVNVALDRGDIIVKARLRVSTLAAGATIGVWIWSGSAFVDQTAACGGPWSGVPLSIDITSFIAQNGAVNDQRTLICLGNKAAGSIANVDYQVFVDVLR